MRIRSLDGLRTVSITLVLLAHIAGGGGMTALLPFTRWLSGQLGVRVFFVISGLLITRLLLQERERTGTVSLFNFYRRRTLRIFPAYFAFLAAMLLIDHYGVFNVSPTAWLQAATYTGNYAILTSPRPYLPEPLGHTWSLAVEEQFYALWPAVFLTAGLLWSRRIAIACVALSPLVLVIVARTPIFRDAIGVTFGTSVHAIAVGCVLALSWSQIDRSPGWSALFANRWLPLAALPLLVAPTIAQLLPSLPLAWALADSAQVIAIGALVAWCVRNHASLPGRVLNSRPFVAVGRVSYSLYLWQQPFLLGPPWIARKLPLSLAATVAFATASYVLIEEPVLRWRDSRRAPPVVIAEQRA